MPDRREKIESPCVKVCVLDRETMICKGCLRTWDEIRDWERLSATDRAAIMTELPDRRSLLKTA